MCLLCICLCLILFPPPRLLTHTTQCKAAQRSLEILSRELLQESAPLLISFFRLLEHRACSPREGCDRCSCCFSLSRPPSPRHHARVFDRTPPPLLAFPALPASVGLRPIAATFPALPSPNPCRSFSSSARRFSASRTARRFSTSPPAASRRSTSGSPSERRRWVALGVCFLFLAAVLVLSARSQEGRKRVCYCFVRTCILVPPHTFATIQH